MMKQLIIFLHHFIDLTLSFEKWYDIDPSHRGVGGPIDESGKTTSAAKRTYRQRST
jgi:hypothetical protein